MVFKAIRVLVKKVSVQTTDETDVVFVIVDLVLFVSQFFDESVAYARKCR